jgi:uncharacterized protein (DUF1778 family)
MATKAARIEFRVHPDRKELIEQAAHLLGLTVAEYAGSRLVQDAQRTIAEHSVTRLTDRDRDIFLAMLESSPEPNQALRRAFQEVD